MEQGGNRYEAPEAEQERRSPRRNFREYLGNCLSWLTGKGCAILRQLHGVSPILTAIATLLLALVAYLQWQTLAKTDITLNKTLVASNRAWLSPVAAAFNGLPMIGQPLKYVVVYGNTGREPALSFAAQQREGVVDHPQGGSWYSVFSANAVEDMCRKSGTPEGAPTIYPSALTDYTYSVGTKTIVTPEIRNGTKVVFVQGCFTYKTFSKRAESAWCFLLVPERDSGTSDIVRWKSARCPYRNHAN